MIVISYRLDKKFFALLDYSLINSVGLNVVIRLDIQQILILIFNLLLKFL